MEATLSNGALDREQCLAEFRQIRAHWESVNPLVPPISFVQYEQLMQIQRAPATGEKGHHPERIHAIETTIILLKFCNLLMVRRAENEAQGYETEMLSKLLGQRLDLSEQSVKRLEGLFSYYVATSEMRLNDTFLKGSYIPTERIVECVQGLFETIVEKLATKRIKPEIAKEVLVVLQALIDQAPTKEGRILQLMISDQRKKLSGKNSSILFSMF